MFPQQFPRVLTSEEDHLRMQQEFTFSAVAAEPHVFSSCNSCSRFQASLMAPPSPEHFLCLHSHSLSNFQKHDKYSTEAHGFMNDHDFSDMSWIQLKPHGFKTGHGFMVKLRTKLHLTVSEVHYAIIRQCQEKKPRKREPHLNKSHMSRFQGVQNTLSETVRFCAPHPLCPATVVPFSSNNKLLPELLK